eukprot:scaffold339212_cov16-Prasinocladus_malaysianus.AAC.1
MLSQFCVHVFVSGARDHYDIRTSTVRKETKPGGKSGALVMVRTTYRPSWFYSYTYPLRSTRTCTRDCSSPPAWDNRVLGAQRNIHAMHRGLHNSAIDRGYRLIRLKGKQLQCQISRAVG